MTITVETKNPPPPPTTATMALDANNKKPDVEANNMEENQTKTSMLQAVTHLFKGSVGAGLFAMGDCFKNGGLAGATLLLPVVAVIAVHCEQILINASILAVEKTPGATFYDYPDTVQKCFEYGPKPFRCFSKLMKLIVEIFLCVTQFGFCSIYFVFITDNLQQVLPQYGINISMNTVMLLTLLPAMIPSLMTNLKHIAPVSMIANLALMFGLIATLVIALKDGPLPSPSERYLITNGSQMSLFFGTALFSYEGIALILPLRNSMREPEKFGSTFGVLNVTLFSISILFIFTGFVSYLRWGEEVQGSITLNLNSEDVFCQVVKIVAALGVFFGYPIQFMILIKIIWVPMKQSSGIAQKYPVTVEVLLRFVMVLLTFGVALAVPHLGLFISLIGALCSTSLALVIPVLVDFVVKAQIPKGIDVRTYFKNIAIVLIAVLGIVTGTRQSILDIIGKFKA